MNEKQIEKMIAKETKGFEKKARKALTDNNPNTNYVQFGNNEFESLFGGENRDNEVEFRLLFTPLAQNNLIKLIKSKDGFGDDWYFQKAKKLNYIQSAHSQSFDYYANPMLLIFLVSTVKLSLLIHLRFYFPSNLKQLILLI